MKTISDVQHPNSMRVLVTWGYPWSSWAM